MLILVEVLADVVEEVPKISILIRKFTFLLRLIKILICVLLILVEVLADVVEEVPTISILIRKITFLLRLI